MSFPLLNELEALLNKGQGVAIIVEGNTYSDDPFFYRHWFDDLARSVTFIPQNGWVQVRKAVSELRERSVVWPVYGIIDRDFAEDHQLESSFATQGILRTPRYTLENYLLEPTHWAMTLRNVYRRSAQELAIAETWGNTAYVHKQIEVAYRQCVPLTSYNWVLHFVKTFYNQAANLLPERYTTYLEHPNAIRSADVPTKLLDLQQQLSCTDNLVEMYHSFSDGLQRSTMAEWQKQISGKAVLQHFHRILPDVPGRGKPKLADYLDRYIDTYPPRPSDLYEVIQRILQQVNLPRSQEG